MKTTFSLFSASGWILLLALLFSTHAKAGHVSGGDLAWKDLGNDTFLITYSGYRNCNDIAMSAMDIYLSAGAKGLVTASCPTTQVSAASITPVSKHSCTRCGKLPNGSNPGCNFAYGIEQFVYTARVNLKKYSGFKGICQVNMGVDDCCRSANLTNGGSGQNFHMEASFDRCHGQESSPVFTSPQLLMVPLNGCISYNLGAVDTDLDSAGNRDSLVYGLIKPMTGASGSYVTWSGKFKYNIPLTFDSFPKANALWNPPSCAGFHLDPFTGELNFKPTKVESTILAISVSEYRKDKSGVYFLVGRTMRDLQLIVLRYPNKNSAGLSGINGGPSTDTTICAGQPLCFTLKTSDADTSMGIQMGWNANLALQGAIFTVSKTKLPGGTFCWTPKASDVSPTPHLFTVYAQDDGNSIRSMVARAYKITVGPALKDSMHITQSCQDVKFNGLPAHGGSNITGYEWYGDDTFSSSSASCTHHYTSSGTYKYYLQVKNAYGCTLVDSGVVVVPTLPAAPAISLSGNDTLTASGSAGRYVWFRDTILLSDSGSTLVAAAPGRYRVQSIDSNGCFSPLSLAYTILATGFAGSKEPAMMRIYPNPTTGRLLIEAPGHKGGAGIYLQPYGPVANAGYAQ